MAKSILYAVNNTDQVLAIGDEISFGTPIRRFGCNCDIRGGNAYIVGSGYYKVDASVTLVALGAGVAVITLKKDGATIATASVTTVAGATYNVDISAVVRQICAYDATITAELTGVAGTVSNATIIVEKV